MCQEEDRCEIYLRRNGTEHLLDSYNDRMVYGQAMNNIDELN
jgi:hypothetical protein